MRSHSVSSIRLSVLMLAVAVAYTPSGFSRADSGTSALHQSGFVAEHVIRRRGSDRILERSTVSVSEHGLKVRNLDAGFDLILNYRDETLWLLDHRRRLRHAVPVVYSDAEFNVDGPGSEALTASALDSGILSRSACAGLTPVKTFDARWRGRPVTISTCVNTAGNPLYRHWYSPTVGLVVRTLDTRGVIEELRRVRPLANAHGFLTVDPTLREVSLQEFFETPEDLQRFDTSGLF